MGIPGLNLGGGNKGMAMPGLNLGGMGGSDQPKKPQFSLGLDLSKA